MPLRHGTAIELRHLRYFVAVVEEGSLTTAAERRLHTSQPSLSRQIRDLEHEVGAALLSRSIHGVELTVAGKAFLDYARLALMQVDAAVEAARRAAQPVRKTFAIGFQTGHEMNWLPRAMHVLRDELKNIEVTVSSDYSPDLAEAVARGRLDLAFLRVESGPGGDAWRERRRGLFDHARIRRWRNRGRRRRLRRRCGFLGRRLLDVRNLRRRHERHGRRLDHRILRREASRRGARGGRNRFRGPRRLGERRLVPIEQRPRNRFGLP